MTCLDRDASFFNWCGGVFLIFGFSILGLAGLTGFWMRRRILGFFRSVWIWRRILGFFGQFGYGGGFLVFSVSVDMEEDSWRFPVS